MEMRDRLIDLMLNAPQIPCIKGGRATGKRYQTFQNIADHLLANGVVVLDTGVISPENRPLITHFADMPINDVLDLVRAKREGRIIVPPCNVGDTVYYVFNGEIRKLTVVSLSYMFTENIKHFNLHTTNYRGAMLSYETMDIGKTVFLTEEEAEKALKERGDNG